MGPPSGSPECKAEFMVTIKYDDLSLAFDFVSSAPPTEHRAFVCMDTGKVYWVSEFGGFDEEDLPDDLDTSDRYLEIPHKNDLDLGARLALRFAEEQLPAQRERVADIFHRRGAYRLFKELLASEGCLEQWYAFEAETTERALKRWCRENDIDVASTK